MPNRLPDPGIVFDHALGYWKTSILSTAITHGVFRALEDEPLPSEDLAERTGISVRGARALLDGLLALGLVTVSDHQYANTPAASTYLVESKPTYLGAFVHIQNTMMRSWEGLPDAVATGQAPETHDTIEENPFWEELVLSIASLARPMAQMAAQRLELAKLEAPAFLDIGGGSGIYSAEWLATNAGATSTQIDWANVNRIARDLVSRAGFDERFRTIDGDFHQIDLGAGAYDAIVYSNIAHQESPKKNVEMFRRIRCALKPGGTLVVSDFVLENDRSGPPFALLFHVNMLLHTQGGASWRETDYRHWLQDAGFHEIAVQRTPMPGSLIYAT